MDNTNREIDAITQSNVKTLNLSASHKSFITMNRTEFSANEQQFESQI